MAVVGVTIATASTSAVYLPIISYIAFLICTSHLQTLSPSTAHPAHPYIAYHPLQLITTDTYCTMSAMSSLLQNPLDIQRYRQALFDLQDTIRISPSDHKRIWPYLSNVWSIAKKAQDKQAQSTGYATSYYRCRFERTPDEPTALSARIGNRNVVGRAHQYTKCSCRMSIKEHSDLVEYTMLSGGLHTHTLDEVDMFKINDAVKNAVLAELAKGYDAKTVTNTFLSKGHDGCYKELVAAGGKYLERSTVQSWKQKMRTAASAANPRKTSTKRDWEDELYEAQVRCSLDNLRYEVLDVKSQAGETVPGIVWASTHRLVVLAERGYLTLFDSTHKPIRKNGSFLRGWCGRRSTSTCLARAL
jgi:hypothetical protein